MDRVTKGYQFYVMVDKTDPRVAIIIRTKDRPDFLRRALASVANQVFQNWEAVIVNDGGDPQEVDTVIAELDSELRPRFRHIVHESPLGRWPSANAGVTATSAPLVVLHDDDDSWHPEFLEETVAYLSRNPDEYGVATRIEVLLEEERDGVLVTYDRYVLESHNEEIFLTDLLRFNRFVPIGFLYRRSLHKRIGMYDESLPAAGDWAFNLAAVSLQPIRYVSDRPLAYWHQRPHVRGVLGNSVHAATADHSFADRAFRDLELREYIQKYGLGLPLFVSSATATAEKTIGDLTAQLEQLRGQFDQLSSQYERLAAQNDALLGRQDQVIGQNDLILHNLSRTMDTRIRGWVVRQKLRLKRLKG